MLTTIFTSADTELKGAELVHLWVLTTNYGMGFMHLTFSSVRPYYTHHMPLIPPLHKPSPSPTHCSSPWGPEDRGRGWLPPPRLPSSHRPAGPVGAPVVVWPGGHTLGSSSHPPPLTARPPQTLPQASLAPGGIISIIHMCFYRYLDANE